MSNIPGYPTTKRRRSKAWIYYAIISILGVVAAPGSHGLSLIVAVLAGLYALYLLAISPKGKLSVLYSSNSGSAPTAGQLDSIQSEGLAVGSHGDLLAPTMPTVLCFKVL